MNFLYVGCGKTTFLDLLAGRHDIESYQGEIFVNGTSLEKVRGWYIAHTGYVLQLATPYYSTLTVRESLTFAAQMRLPKHFTMKEKLERVEQILKEVIDQPGNTNIIYFNFIIT